MRVWDALGACSSVATRGGKPHPLYPQRHSGRFYPRIRTSGAVELQFDQWTVLDRLVDDAIAFRELEQLIELVLRCIGLDVEGEADLCKADRRVLGDTERAAEVEIALGRNLAGLERNVDRGRHRLQG